MILWDVIEEHLDEAAFLWPQWERALVSPRYVPGEVMSGPEERLLAHVQGLLECGPPAVERLLLPALEEEPGRICAAALTLLVDGAREPLAGLLDRLESGGEVYQDCIRRVLEVAGGDALTSCLGEVVQEARAPALVLASVLGALSVRARNAPSLGLRPFLSSREPLLQAAALLAAGRWQRPLLPEELRGALDSPSAVVRDAALEAGLLLGHRAAWDACRHVVASRLPGCRLAMRLLAMGGTPQDLQELLQQLDAPGLREDALRALCASGRPEAVEACLPLLREKKVARLAGEVFSATTGVALEGPLVLESPEEDEDEDAPVGVALSAEGLALGAERELPLPEPGALETAWKEARKRLVAGARHLQGQRLDAETCMRSLKLAPMRRRHDLALELGIRSGGAWRVNTKDFVQVQWAQLSSLSPANMPLLTRPFGNLATR
jgi:uncharacterized protein (TIGR02270 family)